MRRPWPRLLATLLAVWFTAYAVDPASLVACPMHGMATAAMSSAHQSHQSHDMAAPMSGVAHHAPAGSHAPSHHHCTCLGHCCASAVVAIGAPSVAAVASVIVATPVHSFAGTGELDARVRDHALPFATAPPLA